MSKIWENNFSKFLIYVTGVSLGLFVIIFSFINPLLNEIVKQKIINSVNKNRNNKLSIEKVHFIPSLNRLFVSNLYFRYINSNDKKSDSVIVKFPLVSIGGINWPKLISGSGYSFTELRLEKPMIIIRKETGEMKKGKKVSDENQSWGKQLSEAFPKEIKTLKIAKINVESGKFIYQCKTTRENITDTINSISLVISNLAPSDTTKNLSLFDNFKLKLKGFHRRWNKSGYDFKVNNIEASSQNSFLKIDSLSFLPFINDKEFFNRREYRSDRWKVKLPGLSLQEINFQKILTQNIISIKDFTIANFHIEIFTNKRLPPDPQADPQMPHEIVSSLNFGIESRKIKVDTGVIILQSLMPDVDRRAQLVFNNISGSISNISNNPNVQNKKNPCVIDLSAKLQNSENINIKMNLPLLADNLSLNYRGSLDEMSAKKLNSHVEVEDLIRIKSGEITKISFDTEVKNSIATVNIIPLYSDLKIEALDKEAKGKSSLQSAVINAVIRKSNPNENGKIKSGNIAYIRKPKDAFLDVVWQALLKGLGDVVGF